MGAGSIERPIIPAKPDQFNAPGRGWDLEPPKGSVLLYARAVEAPIWRSGPLLLAHRGASTVWPENTMPAYREALAAGADVLEMDVHLTLDGHVVVSHDPTGTRTAHVDRRIRESTLAEVQCWDVSLGFAGACQGPVRMPTLEQVLQELPGAHLNIDIKQVRPEMVTAVLRVVDAHAAQGRVLLTSFSASVVSEVRRRGYPGPTGLGRGEAISAGLLSRWSGPEGSPGHRLQVPTQWFGLPLGRRWLIERARAQGLRVDFWVVNDPGVARSLLDLGADGIVTDDVAALAPVFAAHPRGARYRDRHPRVAAAAVPPTTGATAAPT